LDEFCYDCNNPLIKGEERVMKNNTLRRYVDILMYTGFCFITGSGLLLAYRLKPCSQGGDHGQTLLGMDRHGWGEWHLWVAYAVLALLILHIMLNLTFIINVVVAKSGLLLGLLGAVGAAILLYFLFAPLQQASGGRKCGESTCSSCDGCPSAGQGGGHSGRGSGRGRQ
jgi:hypothetical protein